MSLRIVLNDKQCQKGERVHFGCFKQVDIFIKQSVGCCGLVVSAHMDNLSFPHPLLYISCSLLLLIIKCGKVKKYNFHCLTQSNRGPQVFLMVQSAGASELASVHLRGGSFATLCGSLANQRLLRHSSKQTAPGRCCRHTHTHTHTHTNTNTHTHTHTQTDRQVCDSGRCEAAGVYDGLINED